MKRLCLSLTMAVVAILLVMVPVLAAYYANIVIEETNGDDYDELALIATANISQLAQLKYITSTGLDTRVYTGSGIPLPHMLAEDKLLFVTPLAAYEEKTLLFYTGQSSLSSFPVIVGYGGNVTTADNETMEPGYVFEFLTSGYFDTSAGANKSIVKKTEAFEVYISDTDTLTVDAYNSTGDVVWSLEYASFTTGEHTVYVVADGMQAKLYVDNLVVAKDTENLWENANQQMTGTGGSIPEQAAFYANGRYWCFYDVDSNTFGWRTSTDGDTWETEQTFDLDTGDTSGDPTAIYHRDGYVHCIYASTGNNIKYRRGSADSSGNITWSAGWQLAVDCDGYAGILTLAVDVNGYPFITYQDYTTAGIMKCTKSSTNNGTWTAAGGYPFYINAYNDGWARIAAYYSNDDMYIMYVNNTAGGHTLQGNYYNGSAWGGLHTIHAGTAEQYDFHAASDSDGNLYIVWLNLESVGGYDFYMKIRYADATWSAIIPIADATNSLQDCCVTYNPDMDGVYIFHDKPGDSTLYGYALIGDTLIGPYTFASSPNAIGDIESPAYATHIGIASYNPVAIINHQYLAYSWAWNDNANDWYWMQNNVMPYSDYLMMGVDGELVMHYQPAAIVEDSTLEDESDTGNPGTINWGTNPATVNVTMSGLIPEETYVYTGGIGGDVEDIINPEPETMTGDVDTERLHNNPLYPFVQVLSIGGFLKERLVWLGLAWFILIAAMFGVHLGFDTHKDSEKPQHFVLTTITGLGLSILFYTMGIFPWWVILLMAFGLLGAIIWERQPVL